MSHQTPMLDIEGIGKNFPGVVALKDISFHANAGEAVALVGANGAGKSTLMNILGGVIGKTNGVMRLEGQEVEFRSPIESIASGIAFVSQELNSLPTMSIVENIFSNGLPVRYGLIDHKSAEKTAAELMGQLGFDGDVTIAVERLSTGDRQLVEIARALHQTPKVLIFDEPTSSLSKVEREKLFEVVKTIKKTGVAVIYITHFLEEIFDVCDRLNVLRNGQIVFESKVSDTNTQEVVHQMMGSVESEERLTPYDRSFSLKRIEVSNISQGTKLENISFELFKGEIVGLWGLLGSGRTELLRSMMGLDLADRAEMLWHGENGQVRKVTPSALQKLAGFVTEDRRGEGLLLPQSVADNISLPNLQSLSNSLGVVSSAKCSALADKMISSLSIKVSGKNQICASLSGGNQQKVVFARWLAQEPVLFLLDEPTRGLDVNAKTEILRVVVDLAAQGCAVLIASSELEELMRVCDRYLIISQGGVIGELPAAATRKQLLDAVSTRPSVSVEQGGETHAAST